MTRKMNALESFKTSVKTWRNLLKDCNVAIYGLSQNPSESESMYRVIEKDGRDLKPL